jgi:hypothetical protein
MSDQLTETAAEIAELIPKYSWQIMDEEQRDDLMQKVVLPRYMKTTADGVQTGPTFWADLVGASVRAVESRVYRLRQSQSAAEDEHARALSPSAERHVKSGLRKAPELIPQMVDELHDDPDFQAAVASANSQIEAKQQQRTSQRERIERGISEQELAFEQLRKDIRHGNYGEAERRLRTMTVDDEVGAYLRKQAERHRQLAEWLEAWADATPIGDAQLQEWLS